MVKANTSDEDVIYYGRIMRLKPSELQAGCSTPEGKASLGQIIKERILKNWTPRFERKGADGRLYQFAW